MNSDFAHYAFDLTVIIPTIGRESVISAIDSIVEPELKVEILVVTDKLDDLSGIVGMLAGRNVRIIRGPNLGAPGARNEGMRLSSAKYIAFLDDDDLWFAHKATKQIQEIEKSDDPQNAISVVGVNFLAVNGKLRHSSDEYFDPKRESLANFIVARKKILYGGSPFCTATLLLSSTFRDRIEFDESITSHDDWDFIIRLAKLPETKVLQLPDRLVQVNQGSIKSVSAVRDWRKSLNFLDRHSEEIYGRSRFDFILCNILLPSVNSRCIEGVAAAVKRLPFAVPHLGGVARFCAGVLFNR